MIFTLINPSDNYTLESNDQLVAIAACLWIGGGAYGLQDENQESICPFLLFGGAEKFIKEIFGGQKEYDKFCSENAIPVADCLESFMIMDMQERKTYLAALEAIEDPAKKEKFRFEIHEKNRTSINDIGKRAWKIAALIKNKLSTEEGRKQWENIQRKSNDHKI